jgi:hypothetical protein
MGNLVRVRSPNYGMGYRLSFASVHELVKRSAGRTILCLSSDLAFSKRPSSHGLLRQYMVAQTGSKVMSTYYSICF